MYLCTLLIMRTHPGNVQQGKQSFYTKTLDRAGTFSYKYKAVIFVVWMSQLQFFLFVLQQLT